MAFSLAGLFRTTTADTASVSQTAPRTENAGNGDGGRNLVPGKTVSGEVVGREGDEIQIRIAKDTVISARMEKEIQTNTGQNVTFQIRSNSSGVIALRPLFQNMAQENTALRALAQAGIEANAKSMQMVFSMMKEGMSIDKGSLQEMYRQVAGAEEAAIPSIVQMNRLGIAVTPENLQQFEAYKNYEHQLISAFEQVAEEIPQAVASLFAEGGGQEGMALIDRLMTVFGSMEEAGEEISGAQGEGAADTGTAAGEASGTEAGGQPAGDKTIITESGGEMALPGGESRVDAPLPDQAGVNAAGPEAAAKEAGASAAPAQEAQIPPQDRDDLAQLFRNAGGDPRMAQQIEQGQMGQEELYRAVQELTKRAAGRNEAEAVKELFLSKGFQKIFQNKMSAQWTLTAPENLEKKEVERLYSRLHEQTRQLTQALEGTKADSPLFKSLQNIRDNVDFMNQLNQMYTYVQLPLKFRGENAHGDLYVYTNKKNLARKDGNVSAFLHLDMEYLGMVDVYVAMEKGKISTRFQLEDEKSLELLEKNMDTLTRRLTEKGYRTDVKLTLKEVGGNVMEEILRADKNISMISELSFDVRA